MIWTRVDSELGATGIDEMSLGRTNNIVLYVCLATDDSRCAGEGFTGANQVSKTLEET